MNRAPAGKEPGVESVGLGQFACRLGKAPGLAGIDLDRREARLRQRALESPMIRPSWLEDDAFDQRLRQSFDQSPKASFVVGGARLAQSGYQRLYQHLRRMPARDDGRLCTENPSSS